MNNICKNVLSETTLQPQNSMGGMHRSVPMTWTGASPLTLCTASDTHLGFLEEVLLSDFSYGVQVRTVVLFGHGLFALFRRTSADGSDKHCYSITTIIKSTVENQMLELKLAASSLKSYPLNLQHRSENWSINQKPAVSFRTSFHEKKMTLTHRILTDLQSGGPTYLPT